MESGFCPQSSRVPQVFRCCRQIFGFQGIARGTEQDMGGRKKLPAALAAYGPVLYLKTLYCPGIRNGHLARECIEIQRIPVSYGYCVDHSQGIPLCNEKTPRDDQE